MRLTSVEEYLTKTASGSPVLSELARRVIRDLWERPLPRAALIGIPAMGIGAALWRAFGGGGITEGRAQAETVGYRINRALHGLTDRIRWDETIGTAFADTLGRQSAEKLVGLTTDMMSKAYDTVKDTMQLSPARHAIFETLKREDPILRTADNKTLMEAYHTMANVAPTLATDKNAVRSFLTQAAVSGGGLDYNTIKGIADAEAAVQRAKKTDW